MRFWLGSYTSDSGGRATGIGALRAGEPDVASAGGPLSFVGTAAAAASPSWLAQHPTLDVVYATLEHRGQVAAFRRTGLDSFAPLGTPVDAGEAVCHAAVAPDGHTLVASCWGDGRVVRMSLDAAGTPSTPVIAAAAADPFAGPVDPFATTGDGASGESFAGTEGAAMAAGLFTVPGMGVGPSALDAELAAASRALRAAAGDEYAHLVPEYDLAEDAVAEAAPPVAEGVPERVSRAHAAVHLPDGRVATTDLGFDLVRFWRIGSTGIRADGEVVLPRGSGPRHMVLHPSGHLHVLAEYSREVFTLATGPDGRWRLLGGVAASALTMDGDTGAELARSHDGQFLYAGIRGSDTIATLRVRGEGDRLEAVALVDAGVTWPRHHLVSRDILLVAGERSDDVVSLTLDIRTGVPGRVRSRTEAPSPTRILPARR
ncbi:beta-propeller fold lactonase family protein [Microbacterium sp. 1P10UB]|uniref:lactonase family protein n=1 Tax=unclassified Microbacterium TaxID=2609290 RepID=UPI0039A2A7D8